MWNHPCFTLGSDPQKTVGALQSCLVTSSWTVLSWSRQVRRSGLEAVPWRLIASQTLKWLKFCKWFLLEEFATENSEMLNLRCKYVYSMCCHWGKTAEASQVEDKLFAPVQRVAVWAKRSREMVGALVLELRSCRGVSLPLSSWSHHRSTIDPPPGRCEHLPWPI